MKWKKWKKKKKITDSGESKFLKVVSHFSLRFVDYLFICLFFDIVMSRPIPLGPDISKSKYNYNRIYGPVQILNKFAKACASICSKMIDVFFWQCSKLALSESWNLSVFPHRQTATLEFCVFPCKHELFGVI